MQYVSKREVVSISRAKAFCKRRSTDLVFLLKVQTVNFASSSQNSWFDQLQDFNVILNLHAMYLFDYQK